MNFENELLLIPDTQDVERDRLAQIWQEKGGDVLRIGKFWIRPETKNKRVSIYGYDSFCLVLAQVLNLELYMPKDEELAHLATSFLKREIELIQLQDAHQVVYPKFIKSVQPKLFKAEVFKSFEQLKQVTSDITATELLLVSEVIQVEKEVRSFILDHKIQDLAFYEGQGDLSSGEKFIQEFLDSTKIKLPKTFVFDIGFNQDLGWFAIEFNSSWGAGLNFCQAEKVITCIREATIN